MTVSLYDVGSVCGAVYLLNVYLVLGSRHLVLSVQALR